MMAQKMMDVGRTTNASSAAPNDGRRDNKRRRTGLPPAATAHDSSLDEEQREYRRKFLSQLRFECDVPIQAYCPKVTPEEKEGAAEHALARVQEELAKRQREAKEAEPSDESSDESDYPGASRGSSFALSSGKRKFLLGLKDCLPLSAGFDVEGTTNDKHCYCPCGADLKKWREEDVDVKYLIDERDLKDSPCNRVFKPLGFISHLEDAWKKQGCLLHYGTLKYVEKLYENYNGPGIGHKCLFKMGSKKYLDAEARQQRNHLKAIRAGKQELATEKAKNIQMKTQLELLEKVNEDLFKQKEMLEEWRDMMEVKKKKNRAISERELSSYKILVSGYIGSLKAQHVRTKGDVHITVWANPPSANTSFCLQDFFDGHYDEDPGLSDLGRGLNATAARRKKATREVANVRRLLFGDDIDYVAPAILSTWKITFKESADQVDENTAIDEGGPLKQFKTDCWKQLNVLSIPVEGTMVRLFEDGEGGILPVPNDRLNYDLKRATNSDEEKMNKAFQRAKAYMRAVGRIMFNSFQANASSIDDIDNHSVPRSTMLPIFMNLILRGCIPGDDSYERDDILKHIVPFAPNPKENIIKHHIGKKVDELDEGSPLWTPDLIFQKLIPDQFVHSRSILLDSLADGISFGEKRESPKLEYGCSLAAAFHAIPLEALQSIFFCKSTITVDGVLAVLVPDFCKSEVTWEGSDSQLIEEQEKQKYFFERDFKRYIRKEAYNNPGFLEEFVQFCTGSNYLPFVSKGEKAFKITVEFNFTNPTPGGHPMAHTCVNTIRLPGTGIYFGDYDLFSEKMKEALAQCSRFDME